MIVTTAPYARHSARALAIPLLVLFLWDVAVTLIFLKLPFKVRPLELPLSLFGTAIALFVGFLVNASYARWMEARALWGAMANASRGLARQALTFCPAGDRPAILVRKIVRLQIAYVNITRATLRGEALPQDAEAYLGPDQTGAVANVRNKANAVLTEIGHLAAQVLATDSVARVRIEATLVDIDAAAGGMDRLKTTPLPSHYRFFPSLFARVFCVLLPFTVVEDLGLYTPVGSALVSLMFLMALQIGHDLMNPFAGTIYDVPMSAICRTIEIDLLQMIGEPAPEKIEPKDGILW